MFRRTWGNDYFRRQNCLPRHQRSRSPSLSPDAKRMEHRIQVLAGLTFLITGLSHLLQPMMWVEFFARLREQGRSGAVWLGLIHLWLGLLIVSFHHVWHGLPIVLTLIGWSLLVKSTVYLCWPARAMWALGYVTPEKANRYRYAGILAIPLGALFLWMGWPW